MQTVTIDCYLPTIFFRLPTFVCYVKTKKQPQKNQYAAFFLHVCNDVLAKWPPAHWQCLPVNNWVSSVSFIQWTSPVISYITTFIQDFSLSIT